MDRRQQLVFKTIKAKKGSDFVPVASSLIWPSFQTDYFSIPEEKYKKPRIGPHNSRRQGWSMPTEEVLRSWNPPPLPVSPPLVARIKAATAAMHAQRRKSEKLTGAKRHNQSPKALRNSR